MNSYKYCRLTSTNLVLTSPLQYQDIPDKFKKLLSVPNKISKVVLLGNCTKSYSLINFVDKISQDSTYVRGEFDSTKLPSIKNTNEKNDDITLSTVIKFGNFKIGCCSGYTIVPKNDPLSLLALARQLDVDIMLWGGTHNVEAYTLEGKFFVNPGSCTGAFNTDWPVFNNQYDSDEEIEKWKSTTELKLEEKKGSKPIEAKEEMQETKETNNTNDEKSKKTDIKKFNDEKDKIDDEKDIKNITIDFSEFDVDGSNVPSFCLLDVQGATCTLYIYLYIDGEVKVDKVVYTKGESA